ncbi:MAG: DUF3365 domain-containing protein [Nitrospirales bacterium]
MQQRIIRTVCVLIVGLVAMQHQVLGLSWATDDKDVSVSMKPEMVADYIHAVIEADRTLYTTHVVDRMQETGTVIASEGWKKRNALPLPAQMLLLSGLKVGESGLGLQYRLASLFPIYERNGPTTDFEREGLEAVEKDPSKPYTGVISRGGKRYFKAIYPDKAVSKACVNCHNTHILSGKRDREVGDVMGGVIISFPLD